MLKISYAGCLGLSPAILAQFTLKPFLCGITCFTYGQNLGVLTFIILSSYTGD